MLKKAITIALFPLFLAVARFVPFERLPSPCVFFHLTGLPCPTCGMTRSVIALTHLNLSRAVQMNPLGFLFVGGFGLWWACSVYEVLTARSTRILSWASRKVVLLSVAGGAVLLIYGVARIVWILHRPG